MDNNPPINKSKKWGAIALGVYLWGVIIQGKGLPLFVF